MTTSMSRSMRIGPLPASKAALLARLRRDSIDGITRDRHVVVRLSDLPAPVRRAGLARAAWAGLEPGVHDAGAHEALMGARPACGQWPGGWRRLPVLRWRGARPGCCGPRLWRRVDGIGPVNLPPRVRTDAAAPERRRGVFRLRPGRWNGLSRTGAWWRSGHIGRRGGKAAHGTWPGRSGVRQGAGYEIARSENAQALATLERRICTRFGAYPCRAGGA